MRPREWLSIPRWQSIVLSDLGSSNRFMKNASAMNCRNETYRSICQLKLPIVYRGVRLDAGLRLDLLVDECLIVEIKSVEEKTPVFDAQLLTYLKLTKLRVGLLINFNVTLLKNGINRLVL